MLDHVEGEVVGAAETPDGKGEEEGDLEGGLLEEEQNGGEQADEEEEEALELDETGVGEIFHMPAQQA